jgi:hypothetical protein
MDCKVTCILYKKQAYFSQLFCLQVRSVTPWQSHDRKIQCLRGRRHSLYGHSGFFFQLLYKWSKFLAVQKVWFSRYSRFTIFGTYVFKSNLEHFWQMSRWSPVYIPEIETGRHVKNNACSVEIKIKWVIRKHIGERYISI